MKILLKTATVIESNSPFHTKTVDILIEDGKIKDIEKKMRKFILAGIPNFTGIII